MDASWIPARDAVTSGTQRKTDKDPAQVAGRFDALLRFGSLKLRQRLGAEITRVLSRAELNDPALRTAALTNMLVTEGTLRGEIRIPNTVSSPTMTANLRAGQVIGSFNLNAPSDDKATTHTNGVLRQLRDSPDSIRVEAIVARQRAGNAKLNKVPP